jgi:hypothetical protein
MNNIFCKDFLINFFADLLAGLILAVIVGLPLNWWANRKLNKLAGSEQRKAEERARLEKTIQYLKLLRDEVYDLCEELPKWITEFEKRGWGKEFWISTPHWDILQPSGELPRLLDPGLVGSLSLFYDHLLSAKQGKHWLVTSWLVPTPGTVGALSQKQASFKAMTLEGLKLALRMVGCLPDKLDSEIERLKAELQKL